LQKTEVLSSPLSTFRDVHGDLALNLPAALNLVAPLDRQTLGERAYAKPADLLISGRLAPGEKLSLRAAADVLGVTIMPVREAISRLVAVRNAIAAGNVAAAQAGIAGDITSAADFILSRGGLAG
jgi:hypothetical protein